jgi:ADP-ribose pyrophosphatase YjhB (NUDIX family)
MVQAALREVQEECNVPPAALSVCELPLTATDFVTDAFHYVIVHCYGEIIQPGFSSAVRAGDDASDVGWFTLPEVRALPLGGAVLPVLHRAAAMKQHQLLPLVPATDVSVQGKSE